MITVKLIRGHLEITAHDMPAELTQGLRRLDDKLDALHNLVAASAAREEHTMKELDDVKREVTETGTVIGGAVTLLNSLSQLIRDNAGDPAALRQIAADLDAQQAQLAAAIVANTPSEGAPAEPPAPGTEV